MGVSVKSHELGDLFVDLHFDVLPSVPLRGLIRQGARKSSEARVDPIETNAAQNKGDGKVKTTHYAAHTSMSSRESCCPMQRRTFFLLLS
jgi:hypothetical protein